MVEPTRSLRQRGRKAAGAIYYASVAAICIGATVQVSLQALRAPARPSPYSSCRDGLAALASAVDRARNEAPGTDGEESALGRFRTALEPEWGFRDGIAASCKGTHEHEGALDAIERLRYAEEHAVRREAGELAPLRRRVQAIVSTMGGAGTIGGAGTMGGPRAPQTPR